MYTCGTGVVLYVVQKLLTCTEGFPQKFQTKGICPKLGYLTLLLYVTKIIDLGGLEVVIIASIHGML